MSVTPTTGVVTPEAVVLEFHPAGLATRSLAKLIDLAIESVLMLVLLLILTWVSGGSSTVLVIAVSLVVFFLTVLAPALCETFWNGQTPGKATLGVRVVTTDGGPIGFRHTFVRGLLQLLELPLGIAVFVALASRRSQRLGDMAAGTFVVSERAASAFMIPTVFFPPPGCEGFCHALDVSRVESEQFLLVRNFLLRVSELDFAARQSLAGRLADSLRVLCQPPPPVGMTAELYLVCICSAYQIRHGGLPAQPAPPPAYGAPPGYGPSSGYPPPPGYGPPSGYGPQPGYGPPSGYPPPPGSGPPAWGSPQQGWTGA